MNRYTGYNHTDMRYIYMEICYYPEYLRVFKYYMYIIASIHLYWFTHYNTPYSRGLALQYDSCSNFPQ